MRHWLSEYRRLLTIMRDPNEYFDVRYDAACRALPYEMRLRDLISDSPNIIPIDRGKHARGMRRLPHRSKVPVQEIKR
jgi:hypothetical protein